MRFSKRAMEFENETKPVTHSRESIEIIATADAVGSAAGNCTKKIISRFCRWILFKIRNIFKRSV